MAVGQFTGVGFLHDYTGSSGNNEGVNFVTLEQEGSDTTPVSVISLDDYCAQRAIDHIDMLKLDIEGGEYAALLGAESLLKRKAIKLIFLELYEWAANRSNSSTTDIKRLLKEANYSLYQLHKNKLHAVNNNNPETDHNFIALPNPTAT